LLHYLLFEKCEYVQKLKEVESVSKLEVCLYLFAWMETWRNGHIKLTYNNENNAMLYSMYGSQQEYALSLINFKLS